MSRRLVYVFVFALLFRLVLSFIVWHPDVWSNMDWGVRFFQYGPSGFFAPEANVWNFTWPNQPPGSIWLYAGIFKLFEIIFSAFWFLNVNFALFPSGIITFIEGNLYPALLQWPSIFADLGIAWLLYDALKRLKSRRAGEIGAILFLLNPVIWYNSAVWGQTDGLINFFGLFAVYLLFKKKLVLSFASLALSLYLKVSLAIFIPVYLVVAYRKYCFRDMVVASVPSFIFIWIASLPFSSGSGKDPFGWLLFIYKERVLTNQLQVITANAFNVWGSLTGIHEQPHSQAFVVLTYQQWGIILLTLAFLPILYSVWKKQDEKTVYWALALSGISVWMLLTNMHERYLYPFFPYATILAVLYRGLMPFYLVISGVTLVNLYNFWWTPKIEPLVAILSYGNKVVPRWLGVVNFVVYLFFYNRFIRRARPKLV